MHRKTGRIVNLSSLRMQNNFYKPQTNASAIRFAVLAAEVCEPTRTCRAGGNGNESNREEGKRANDRARLIRECSYSMASAPWPAFSFTSSIFSFAWGGKEMLVLLANSWVTSKVVVSDEHERQGDASRISVGARSSLNSEPLTVLELFKIHVIWICSAAKTVSIFRVINLLIYAHNFAHRETKVVRRKNNKWIKRRNNIVIIFLVLFL